MVIVGDTAIYTQKRQKTKSGEILWKELINLRKDKRAKYTASVREWLRPQAEEYLKDVEIKVARDWPTNRFCKEVKKWLTNSFPFFKGEDLPFLITEDFFVFRVKNPLFYRQKKLFLYAENEILQIKKTSGFSKAFSERKAGFCPFFDCALSALRKDDDGDFHRQTPR